MENSVYYYLFLQLNSRIMNFLYVEENFTIVHQFTPVFKTLINSIKLNACLPKIEYQLMKCFVIFI